MADAQTLIDRILSVSERKEEICLYFFPEPRPGICEGDKEFWRASLGNPSAHLLIGEVDARHEAQGSTLIDALKGLLNKLHGPTKQSTDS